MAGRQLVLWFVVAVVAAGSDKPDFTIQPKSARIKPGESQVITCKANQTLSGCWFYKDDFDEIDLSKGKDSEDQTANITYHGSGLQDGDCGVEVKGFPDGYNCTFTCVGTTKDNDLLFDVMMLKVSSEPEGTAVPRDNLTTFISIVDQCENFGSNLFENISIDEFLSLKDYTRNNVKMRGSIHVLKKLTDIKVSNKLYSCPSNAEGIKDCKESFPAEFPDVWTNITGHMTPRLSDNTTIPSGTYTLDDVDLNLDAFLKDTATTDLSWYIFQMKLSSGDKDIGCMWIHFFVYELTKSVIDEYNEYKDDFGRQGSTYK